MSTRPFSPYNYNWNGKNIPPCNFKPAASVNHRSTDSFPLASREMVSDVQSNGKCPSSDTSSKVASENLQWAVAGPYKKPAIAALLNANHLRPYAGIGNRNAAKQKETALELMFKEHNEMSSLTILERLIKEHNAEMSRSGAETDEMWAVAGPNKKPANKGSTNGTMTIRNTVARDHWNSTSLERMVSEHNFENFLENSQVSKTESCSWISSDHSLSDMSEVTSLSEEELNSSIDNDSVGYFEETNESDDNSSDVENDSVDDSEQTKESDDNSSEVCNDSVDYLEESKESDDDSSDVANDSVDDSDETKTADDDSSDIPDDSDSSDENDFDSDSIRSNQANHGFARYANLFFGGDESSFDESFDSMSDYDFVTDSEKLFDYGCTRKYHPTLDRVFDESWPYEVEKPKRVESGILKSPETSLECRIKALAKFRALSQPVKKENTNSSAPSSEEVVIIHKRFERPISPLWSEFDSKCRQHKPWDHPIPTPAPPVSKYIKFELDKVDQWTKAADDEEVVDENSPEDELNLSINSVDEEFARYSREWVYKERSCDWSFDSQDSFAGAVYY